MTLLDVAVVTGATGFIGAPLVRKLAATGTRVICPIRPASTRKGQIDGIDGVERIEIASFDADTLGHMLDGRRVDAVFHLAAYGVLSSERDPIAMLEGNATLTASVLVAAKEWAARRVVFAGSCSEYAPATDGTLIDERHGIGPTTLYGAAKAAATVYATTLAPSLGVQFVPLRIFGTYGVGEAKTRLLPHVIERLSAGEEPELTLGGHIRDLSYIDDVVDALIVAASHTGLQPGQPYNVCSGIARSVASVARRAAELMDLPDAALGLGRRPYRADEPDWLVGDPSRFRAATGWSPRVSLDDGIRRMIEAHHARA